MSFIVESLQALPCLLCLTDFVKELSNGKLFDLFLLNLQKAFNSVNHGILLEKLNYIGVKSVDWWLMLLRLSSCLRLSTLRDVGDFWVNCDGANMKRDCSLVIL